MYMIVASRGARSAPRPNLGQRCKWYGSVASFTGVHPVLGLSILLTYFIATPPYRGWQRSEGRLLLHSFLSLDMFVAFVLRSSMLQCVARLCSKRRHVRLLCLLGTSCEVSPSAATGGDLRVRGRILRQEKLSEVLLYHLRIVW